MRVAGGATCREARVLFGWTDYGQVPPASYGPRQIATEERLEQRITDKIGGNWVCEPSDGPRGGITSGCRDGTKRIRYVFF